MSIPTSMTNPRLGATVLRVQYYPTDEIIILVDGSPAVVTLRNVKKYQAPASTVGLTDDKSVSKFDRNMDISGIVKGTRLDLVESGTWNVNTATLDNCQLRVLEEQCSSMNITSIKSKVPSVASLPIRRKRQSMQ